MRERGCYKRKNFKRDRRGIVTVIRSPPLPASTLRLVTHHGGVVGEESVDCNVASLRLVFSFVSRMESIDKSRDSRLRRREMLR